MSNQGRFRGRGFTAVEAFIIVIIVVLLIAMFLPAVSRSGCGSRQLKDSSQVRGIHQSMVQWALQNSERFPLPSVMDPQGNTVDVGQRDDPSQAFKLDSTRNIFSMLIFNGAVPLEMYISPAEQGPIIQYEKYQVVEPAAAADPSLALWDPAFCATPRDSAVGGQSAVTEGSFSYAHTLPFGRRRESTWRDTYRADQAVLGNRGASWTREGNEWTLLDDSREESVDYSTPMGENSNTLLIHGSRLKWEGYIAYQDNRVVYETQPDSEDLPLTFSSLGVRADNLFANEDDATGQPDAEGRVNAENDNENAFLRSYSDRISGAVGAGALDVYLEVFYD